MANNNYTHNYWKENTRYLSFLLAIWFVVAYVLSIFFAPELNHIKLAGFKLGFWFAQQGSIYAFIALIFLYVYHMNRLDKKYNVDEEE